MNTTLKTRIIRVTSSIAGALLVTFTCVQLIANYALPEPAVGTQLAAASPTSAK